MLDLLEISKKFITDSTKYDFLLLYKNYFETFRNKKINLLEIGIDKGNSLRLWREFFFNANIIGIDIEKKDFKIEGVDFLIGDQSNLNFLKKVTNKYNAFDIIIDDGSHFNEHIISSFNYFFPYLNKDGIYIVEDLQTSYIPRYGGSRFKLNKKNTSMNFFKRLSDSVNYEQYDRPFIKKNFFDGKIKSVHFHQNIVFVYKGNSINYYHPDPPKNNFLSFIKRIFSKFFD